MANAQPHLELRTTGYYWRRRVPAREKARFKPDFFCFPLRTHVPRDAAELARRLTAVSDLCFNAESHVSPEIMTDILVTYARIEIETADRLRALTGPRTRQAGEVAMALETAARASLRDAIFLCDTTPALTPIRDVATRLGLALDEGEEDFAVLADRMVRLMIEISEEKERRARGHFSEPQPYLSAALRQPASTPLSSDRPSAPTVAPAAPVQPIGQAKPRETGAEPEAAVEAVATPMPIGTAAPAPFHKRDGLSVSVDAGHGKPTCCLDGSDPRLLDLWDDWFDEMSRGVRIDGAYTFEDAGKAKRFTKDADTIRSTRKLTRSKSKRLAFTSNFTKNFNYYRTPRNVSFWHRLGNVTWFSVNCPPSCPPGATLVGSKIREIVFRNVPSDIRRNGERDATPALAHFGYTVPPDELGAVGKAQDHLVTKSGPRAQIQEFVGASALDHRLASGPTAAGDEHQRQDRSNGRAAHKLTSYVSFSGSFVSLTIPSEA